MQSRPSRSRTATYLKYALVFAIVSVCVVMTIRVFDWQSVWTSVRHMRAGVLLGAGLPILGAIFLLRGLRWLVVLGIAPTRDRFWKSFCANGAALGLASLTPFLLGEIIKIRLIPDDDGSAWKLGASGLLVERTMDVCGVVGMGLCGLALHYGPAWLAPAGLLMPLLAALALSFLSVHIHRLPAQALPYVEAFRHARRITLTSLLTIPIWLSYTALFWVAALAMNVTLSASEVTLLLGGITLVVAASMAPGGLGVSELGSRGIMIWLGASTDEAEATAIALRTLTPLIAISGLICMLPLIRKRIK